MSESRVLREGESPQVYELVTSSADFEMVATALDNTPLVAVDIETTGLDPRADRIRLLSVGTDTIDGGHVSFLIDCFAVDPAPLWSLLAEKELVFHNGLFDLGFLALRGFWPGQVHDTMLMAKLLASGTRDGAALADCCQRYLGRELDKSEQASDWCGSLSPRQLDYAAKDVQVLVPLFRVLHRQIAEAGLNGVADLERRCLPALVWMGHKGIAFDSEAWMALAAEAEQQADECRIHLDAIAPAAPGSLPGISQWNWDSAADGQKALAAAGIAIESTRHDELAGIDHPLANALREYRALRKRSTSYGGSWLKHVRDGRIFAKWWQIGADSGRMSCSHPNLQNLPRDPRYRKCFVAPPGRLLIKADYSQIELRIAARVANESTMIEAFRRGEDLHLLTARQILGKSEVSKSDRQLAKALNFGLLYGMGANALRAYANANYGVDLADAQAQEYRRAFFRTYPGLASWHAAVGRSGNEPVEGRTLLGRRKLGITHFTEKLNMPVQGAGADGLKLALALMWEQREQCRDAVPVLAVHDEIVVECDAERADAAARWLKQAMVDAVSPMIAPVPVEVEVTTGRTWGG
jgi:DNA polymerase-1